MFRDSRLRRVVGKLILLGIGVGAALLCAEVALRLFPGFLPPERRAFLEAGAIGAGVPHPYIGTLQTPNSTWVLATNDFSTEQTTDEHGFRNRGPWPDRADIVVLGDSLAFGYGVSDTASWPAILDRTLPDLKVMNLGLIGAGPEQYKRVYSAFGAKLEPRLVIVGMFTGNDFWDTAMFNRWLKSGVDGSYMHWRDYGRGSASVYGSVKRAASAHSYLFNLVLAARDRMRKRDADRRTLALKDGGTVQLALTVHKQLTAGSVAGSAELTSVVKSLAALKALTDEQGADLLVVFQPSKEEVYGPVAGLHVRDSSEALRTELDSLRVRYINLLPTFQERAMRGEALFFEIDGHPNQSGYRLTAESVISYLREHRDSFKFPGSFVDSTNRVRRDAFDPSRRSSAPAHGRLFIH